MENSNGRNVGLNKRVISFVHHIVLLAMLHSSFVAPAQGIIDAYIHNKKPLKYSGQNYPVATANPEAEQNNVQSLEAYPKYEKTVMQSHANYVNNTLASYAVSADIKEGIIGISKDKPLDSPSDNLFKVNLDQLPHGNDKVYLTYEVFGVADHQSVARSINDRLSVGGHLVKKQQGWSVQKEEISALWLHKGQNTILFTIPNGADYQYKIKNLSIRVERNEKVNSLLVLDNQTITFSKDNKVYVKGFLRGNYPEAKIEANGTLLQVCNNEFEGFINLTDEIKRNGFLMIKAMQNSQLLGQELVFVDNAIEADRIFTLEKKESAVSKLFKAGISSRLDIEGASITAADSTLSKDYELSIVRLRNIDVAPMESGMINVTKGGRGYRFLPDGTKFEKPVSLSIAYDSKLIPTGYTEKDIKTYYFDTKGKRWVAINKDSIDVKSNVIISKTTHFTDYINGIIQAPDSPETSAFTPTMMSDVKAADPSAEMTLISPPSASQKGDANISYPIKLPSGRRGMQPQLALQYTSEGGNGWLGNGWSLSIPAITLDTRWGTPLFDPAKETEIYSLNGEQLMYEGGYLPHRHRYIDDVMTTEYINRNTGGPKKFFPRKQGSFAKIERLGNTPQSYYWKVTTTDGTVYWYGGKTAALDDFVIKDDRAAHNIVHWALYMVEDVYGNNIKYSYQKETLGGNIAANPGLEGGRFFEIEHIYYTGKDEVNGNYRVDFEKEPSVVRTDLTIDARLGVKRVWPYRLKNISVNYLLDANPLIRKYSIDYEIGKLGKSRPVSITESSGDGQFSYTHNFEYYNDITQNGVDVYFGAGINTTACIEGESTCPDTDDDGVCNSADACPDIPGPASNYGCPEPIMNRCFRVTFKYYTGKPIHIVINNIELPNSPYILPTQYGQLISDIGAQFGYNAYVEPGNPVTLFITGSGILLTSITTYFDSDNDNYAVTNLPFNNCMSGKSAALTTFSTPPSSSIDYSYHSFYDQVKNNFTIGFSGTSGGGNPDCPWLTNYDFLIQGYMPSFISAPAALGSSKSESYSIGGYAGVGVGGNPLSKPTTFGGQYTYGWEKALGYVASVDITGDGLEDIVIKDNDMLYYKKHVVTRTYDSESNEIVTHSFETKTPIEGMNNFLRSNSETTSFNFQVTFKAGPVGGFGTSDNSNTKSETDIYFTDANGDGLIDIVRDEVVYFNYINNGVPKFEPDSKKTENMVITAKAKAIGIPEEYIEQSIEYPKYDVVKVWEAPANGTIEITNDIVLTDLSKKAIVTIEMPKKTPSECYSVTFPIPQVYATVYPAYFHQNGVIHGAPNDPCYYDPTYCKSYDMTYDGNVYDTSLFVFNGDDNGLLNPTVCPAYYFSDYSERFQQKLLDESFYQNNPNAFLPYFSTVGVTHSIDNRPNTPWPNSYMSSFNWSFSFFSTTPLGPSGLGYGSWQFDGYWAVGYGIGNTSIPWNLVGVPVFLKINGQELSVDPFDIENNFEEFKQVVESQFPVEVTIDGNNVTITSIDGISQFNNIVVTSDDLQITNTYSFSQVDCNEDPYADRIVQHQSDPAHRLLTDWNGYKPTNEQIKKGFIKYLATGNDIKISDDVSLPYTFSHDFTNSKSIEGLSGIYTYSIDYDKSHWENEGAIVSDKRILDQLNAKYGNGLREIYLETRRDYFKEYEKISERLVEKAKIEYNLQQDGILASRAKKHTNIKNGAELTTFGLVPTAPSEMCQLFADVLSSSQPVINNTITNASTDCEPTGSLLRVRKGDRIYFRVHSIDEGNAKINWDPAIAYTNAAMASLVDQNGETPFASQYSDGFILAGTSPLVFPGNGVADISWPALTVNDPSDDVTYEIYRKDLSGDEANYGNIQPTLIYQRKCNAGSTTIVSPATNQVSGSNIGNILVSTTNMSSQEPNITIFYFKVSSTSNVRWKEWQWMPKVVCVTKNTIVDENQVSQGNADFTDVRYPLPDYTIYKSFRKSAKYNLYDISSISAGGNPISIKPKLNGVSFYGLKGQLYFVVKSNGNLLGKRTFDINNNSVLIDDSSAIDLPINCQNIEVGYYTDDSGKIDIEESIMNRLANSGQKLAELIVSGNVVDDIFKQNVNLFHRPIAKFGPMYRQWGQFAYNPENVTGAEQGTFGPLIKEQKLMLTDENSQALQDAATQAENLFSNVNLDTDYQAFVENMNNFQTNNQELYSLPFIPLSGYRNLSPAEGYQEKWQGLHAESYAGEFTYRAATMEQAYTGMDDGDQNTEQDVVKTGAYAITRYSTGEGKNLAGGAGIGLGGSASVSVNGSKSINGSNNMLTDYVDLNGDRYPDIVSKTHIQYTTKTGGLTDSELINGVYNGNLGDYVNSSWGMGASGSVVVGGKPAPAPDPKSKRPQFSSFKGNNSVGISGNYSEGDSNTKKMWADINGDGMADLLSRDPSTGLVTVKMNLGDSRLPIPNGAQTSWGAFKLAEGKSRAVGGGVGGSLWNGSIEFGASVNRGDNDTDFTLTDMNADGIADLVISDENGFKVRLNRGGNFAAEVSWSNYNLKNNYEVVSASTNAGGSLAWVFGIPFTPISLKLIDVSVNGTPYSTATNKTKKSITDYDGDGYPDLLEEISPGTVRIRPSNIRRTDLLKSVNNPLGGKFTVDYKVLTPTYSNPNAKWVMKSVVIEDGYDLVNDGVDTYSKNFEYENGYYDRREREFYGYEKVKTIDNIIDAQGQVTGVYRTAVSEFHNKSYYLNGMMKASYLMRGSDITKLYSKSINSYKLKALDMTTGLIDMTTAAPILTLTFDTGGTEGRKAAAVLLESTENYIYEFGDTPLISRVEFTYNDQKGRGRITKYDYKGDISQVGDNYTAEINYFPDATLESKNIYTVPGSIIVKDHLGATLRIRVVETIDPNTGAITMIGAYIDPNSGEVAETMMWYDIYGNLIQVTGPQSADGQWFTYMYQYDTDNHKLPVRIEDSFGYVSQTSYNNKFDKVTKSTDITNNVTEYTYDSFGRMLTIRAPKEIEASVPYTISFGYYPKLSELTAAYGCAGEENFMPVAITSHYDYQHPTNDIQTYTFIDGMARLVQVKKDIEINTGDNASPNLVEAVSISGKTYYDQYGRVNYQFLPYFENKDCGLNLVVNEYASPYASATGYDELDRPDYIVDFEGNTTSINYAISGDFYNNPSLKTTTSIQQNGSQNIVSQTMKDVNGRVTAKVDILLGANAADLWYRFDYNSIGELVSYTDSQNLSTTYKYDMIGRKTELVHPDNGKTTYYYDTASNLTKLQTANLAADNSLQPEDRFIKYIYYYNRLIDIRYPDTPFGPNISNVRYAYGDTGNETGRLTGQYDASGTQQFQYGNMGEMISNTRTVVGPNIPTRTFTTSFNYDSWNRVKDITYPDGEVVTHEYNKGGNLVKITGDVGGSPYDYIQRIDYDYFEQKTYQLYGNGTDMAYAYTPGLRRLNTMVARTSLQENFLDNIYTYDKVGNVTSLVNAAVANSGNLMGGTFEHHYTYDNLNRLTGATGSFTGNSGQAANNNDYLSEYSLGMTYNLTHGIVSKEQHHDKNGANFAANTYINAYEYYGGTHRLHTLTDAYTNAVDTYNYDLNGNIREINNSATSVTKSLYWDESNRLRVLDDQQSMQHYIYDDAGERILKASAQPEQLYNNGLPVDGSISFDSYTTYPSAYIVVNPDGQFSKHYYAGSQRIVSRVADQDASIFETPDPAPKPAPVTDKTAGSGEEVFSEDKLRELQIKDLTSVLAKAERGTPVFKEFKPVDETQEEVAGEDEGSTDRVAMMSSSAPALYFYHPDHLGTSTFLTDANGELYQFFLNLPFGETMAEQHSLTQDYETQYKFNGKELDSETGLYYYGARYYDPRASIWLSTDPLMEKYPNVNPYVYCLQNPVNAIDPDGRDIIVLRNSDGANGTGHGAILVGDNKNGWTYISKDGYTDSPFGSQSKYVVMKFNNIEEFRNSVHNFETNETHSTTDGKTAKNLTFKLDKNGNKIQRYDEAIYFPTTQLNGSSTDAKTVTAATNSAKETYCLMNGDCSDVITGGLSVSKDNTGKEIIGGNTIPINQPIIDLWNERPNTKFNAIKRRNTSDINFDDGVKPDSYKLKNGEKGS